MEATCSNPNRKLGEYPLIKEIIEELVKKIMNFQLKSRFDRIHSNRDEIEQKLKVLERYFELKPRELVDKHNKGQSQEEVLGYFYFARFNSLYAQVRGIRPSRKELLYALEKAKKNTLNLKKKEAKKFEKSLELLMNKNELLSKAEVESHLCKLYEGLLILFRGRFRAWIIDNIKEPSLPPRDPREPETSSPSPIEHPMIAEFVLSIAKNTDWSKDEIEEIYVRQRDIVSNLMGKESLGHDFSALKTQKQKKIISQIVRDAIAFSYKNRIKKPKAKERFRDKLLVEFSWWKFQNLEANHTEFGKLYLNRIQKIHPTYQNDQSKDYVIARKIVVPLKERLYEYFTSQ